MKDEWLLAEDFASYIQSSQYLGALDEYEQKAMDDFWNLCLASGLEFTSPFPFQIPNAVVGKMLQKLRDYQMPDNLWHHELKAKVIEILEKASTDKMGLLGF